MKTRRIVWVVGLLVVFTALVLGIAWWADRYQRTFFAEDAVRVIAYEVSRLYRENQKVSQAQIDDEIKFLHTASVINLRLDPAGKAVDPFGTPFKVQHELRDSESVTIVASAGPDCRFETKDDICFTYKMDLYEQPLRGGTESGSGLPAQR